MESGHDMATNRHPDHVYYLIYMVGMDLAVRQVTAKVFHSIKATACHYFHHDLSLQAQLVIEIKSVLGLERETAVYQWFQCFYPAWEKEILRSRDIEGGQDGSNSLEHWADS